MRDVIPRGAVAEWVRLRALDWRPGGPVPVGSNPAAATSLRNFAKFGNSVTTLCQGLSGETLKPSVPSIWCLCQGKLNIPPVCTEKCEIYSGLDILAYKSTTL